MVAPGAAEALSQRATLLRDTLQRSRSNTETMVATLGSFDHRLSTLESAMRPTQVRTHAIRMAHVNVEKTLKATVVVLKHFELLRQAEVSIWRGPHENLEGFLDAIDQLKSNISFFSAHKISVNGGDLLNHANNLLSKAVIMLVDEFRQILSTYSKPIELECISDCPSNPVNHYSAHQARKMETPLYRAPTLIPPRIITLLHNLAQHLFQAGYKQKCSRIYSDARASSLESSLQKIGVDNLNKEDVQKMQWETLETKIQNWIHFMQIAVNLLFAAERKICDQIFVGITFNKDLCFAEVTINSVSMLVGFGDSVAQSKQHQRRSFHF